MVKGSDNNIKLKGGENQMVKAKCPHCNYEWDTKSILKFITCPSCLRKFELQKTIENENEKK